MENMKKPQVKTKEELLDEFLDKHYSMTKSWHNDPEFRSEVQNTLGFASYNKDYHVDQFKYSVISEFTGLFNKIKSFICNHK